MRFADSNAVNGPFNYVRGIFDNIIDEADRPPPAGDQPGVVEVT